MGSIPGLVSARDLRALARTCDIRGLRLTRDGGLLVLDGQVPCYGVKKLAATAAAQLFGAPQVVNRLRVVPHGRRRDAELVEALRSALYARMVARGEAVRAGVRRRKSARRPARGLSGTPARWRRADAVRSIA